MSSTDTQQLIDQLQRDIQAFQSQMNTANDRDDQAQIPGLQQNVNEKTAQITALQSKLAGEREQEKKDAAQEAYDEGKEDGKGNMFGL